jgi:transcriptional/translational regulatory protein YebC/TACO1
MFPPGIATVIDCQTDNKLRTLADVRQLVKVHQGSVTPTTYLFQRKGRVVLAKKEGMDEETVLEAALEAGALDVKEEEDKTIVYTEANDTKAVAQALSESLGSQIEEAEMIWDPNADTAAALDSSETAQNLTLFVERAQDQIYGFQAMHHNATQGNVNDEEWSNFQSRIVS